MFYIDTSIMVAAFVTEAQTLRAQAWTTAQSDEDLGISDWTIAEFSSALAIKLRTRQMQAEHQRLSLSAFRQVVEQSVVTPAAYPAISRPPRGSPIDSSLACAPPMPCIWPLPWNTQQR